MVAKLDTENSRIIFSVKGFIGVITFIFSVFFGFYLMVVVPKFNSIDEYIKEQNKTNKELVQQINQLNLNITLLSAAISKTYEIKGAEKK